jgi:hypothetical protein
LQLQKQLLDENELISNAGKLQPLPRTPSVREILAQFIESKGALDTVESKLSVSAQIPDLGQLSKRHNQDCVEPTPSVIAPHSSPHPES